MENHNYTPGIVKKATLHSAITATVAVGSATPLDIAGAKKVLIEFTEGGTVNNRSGLLTLYGSADGTTYTALNVLVSNAANSASQNLTRVATITRATAGTDLLAIEPAFLGGIVYIKAAVTITDGAAPTGNFTVKVNAQI